MRTRAAVWIVGLVTAAALVAPLGAGAMLVFTRNPLHPAVFAASDSGKGAHRIGSGSSPRVSPDGKTIVFRRAAKISEMAVVPAAGGKPRTLLEDWQEPFDFAFSPDSTMVAAERGHELGKRKLVVVDVATGRQQVLATGYFGGFSFSPDGSELVFAKSGKSFSVSADLYRVSVSGGGKPVALTNDHRSTSPLWSPNNQIVFDRVSNLKSELGPKAQLYLMNPHGGGAKQLTHTKVPPLIFGLSPVAFSSNGRRLLAEYGGEDTAYAVTVNPRTGAERKVIPGDQEIGFYGTALSADGKSVLGTSSVEPGRGQHIEAVPYAGGKRKVLVANGYEPDWSR
jgi:Tol biopolymer transport system component